MSQNKSNLPENLLTTLTDATSAVSEHAARLESQIEALGRMPLPGVSAVSGNMARVSSRALGALNSWAPERFLPERQVATLLEKMRSGRLGDARELASVVEWVDAGGVAGDPPLSLHPDIARAAAPALRSWVELRERTAALHGVGGAAEAVPAKKDDASPRAPHQRR
jgi:hypothetical protein